MLDHESLTVVLPLPRLQLEGRKQSCSREGQNIAKYSGASTTNTGVNTTNTNRLYRYEYSICIVEHDMFSCSVQQFYSTMQILYTYR